MIPTDTAYVSVSETARILGACPATVRRLIARGKLRALALGPRYRVDLESIGALRVETENGQRLHD